MTWWLDNAMDDGARQKAKVANSHPLRAADYYGVMYVFDELIQNRDRNQGNIMWSPDSRMWMIDHTRAFRMGRDLLKPDLLSRVERSLYEKLKELDRKAFTESVGRTLTGTTIVTPCSIVGIRSCSCSIRKSPRLAKRRFCIRFAE